MLSNSNIKQLGLIEKPSDPVFDDLISTLDDVREIIDIIIQDASNTEQLIESACEGASLSKDNLEIVKSRMSDRARSASVSEEPNIPPRDLEMFHELESSYQKVVFARKGNKLVNTFELLVSKMLSHTQTQPNNMHDRANQSNLW